MSSPLSILFDQPGGRRGMAVPVTSALAKSVGIVLIAEAIVRAIVSAGSPGQWWALALLGAGLRGLSLWIDRRWGTRAAAAAHRRLRASILSTLLHGRSRPRASTAVAVTRGVDDLEDYFTTVVPALSAAAVVPATLLIRIVFTDLLSALIIVACLPLVPVFMILIGRYTAESTAATNTALARMSDHLAELAAGLPVLIGVGRSRDHARSLRRLGEEYQGASLKTLRIAFLSSLALELIATISVALVAVVIGLRLVSGSMDLASGLLVLLLAPECFIPLRQLGAGYHASENGREAYDRAQTLIADAADQGGASTSTPTGTSDATPISGLTPPSGLTPTSVEDDGPGDGPGAGADHVTHSDGTRIVWTGRIASHPGITAITGATGAGKSSVLAALAGTLPAAAESSVMPRPCAYVPQSPQFFAETVGEELAVFGLPPERAREALDAANLSITASTPIAALSPGQLRRLALVRVTGRIDSGAEVLVLDEPTAHLDEENARQVIAMIASLAARIRVVLASHDEHVLALAEREIRPVKTPPAEIPVPPAHAHRDGEDRGDGEESGIREEGEPSPSVREDTAPLPTDREDTVPVSAVGVDTAAPPAERGQSGQQGPSRERPTWSRRWSTLRASMPMLSGTMVLALVTACAASLAGIALTAVSAWLIVEASYQPPIMTLMVAIVGVRFFGLSRSLLQYLSRLKLHAAIFAALTRLRSALWGHFERAGTSDRKLLTSALALRTMVADADDVRDLVPRALVPPVVSLMVFAAVLVTAGFLEPASLPLLLLLGVLNLVLVPALLLRAQTAVEARISGGRTRILTLITRALASATDLSANRASASVLSRLAEAEDDLGDAQRSSAQAFGAAQFSIEVSTAAAAVAIAVTTAAPTEVLAVVVLMTLGLTDVFASGLAAWRELPALGLVLDRLPDLGARAGAEGEPPSRTGDGLPEAGRAGPRAPCFESLELEGITLGWDGRPVLRGLDLHADRNRWTVVVGDSGSGKSTTLSVLLRFLDPWSGSYRATSRGRSVDVLGFAPAQLAGSVAWCPQEAHVFRSTVRGNLAIARAEAPSETEMCEALTRAGLGEWANPEGLARWVGDQGSEISGGQRQRLAVARTLLSGARVIVLDEPTAHLDRRTAESLLSRLRAGLSDRTVVLVTHDRGLIDAGDRVVDLAAGRLSPASSRT